MPELYHGSCQCGAVSFEATLDLASTVTCNCSRCRRMGFVLSFAPRDSFTLLTGADNLTEYLFNRHVIRHQFCKTCGVQGFGMGRMPDGSETVAVNVNCLDGVDPRTLTPHPYDGKST